MGLLIPHSFFIRNLGCKYSWTRSIRAHHTCTDKARCDGKKYQVEKDENDITTDGERTWQQAIASVTEGLGIFIEKGKRIYTNKKPSLSFKLNRGRLGPLYKPAMLHFRYIIFEYFRKKKQYQLALKKSKIMYRSEGKDKSSSYLPYLNLVPG